jgi:hypothetical protein
MGLLAHGDFDVSNLLARRCIEHANCVIRIDCDVFVVFAESYTADAMLKLKLLQ